MRRIESRGSDLVVGLWKSKPFLCQTSQELVYVPSLLPINQTMLVLWTVSETRPENQWPYGLDSIWHFEHLTKIKHLNRIFVMLVIIIEVRWFSITLLYLVGNDFPCRNVTCTKNGDGYSWCRVWAVEHGACWEGEWHVICFWTLCWAPPRCSTNCFLQVVTHSVF